eukprot:1145617-Pelagomonas_calceolata.AAC.5
MSAAHTSNLNLKKQALVNAVQCSGVLCWCVCVSAHVLPQEHGMVRAFVMQIAEKKKRTTHCRCKQSGPAQASRGT